MEGVCSTHEWCVESMSVWKSLYKCGMSRVLIVGVFVYQMCLLGVGNLVYVDLTVGDFEYIC